MYNYSQPVVFQFPISYRIVINLLALKDYTLYVFLFKFLSEPVFVKDYDEDSQGCVSSQDVLAHL